MQKKKYQLSSSKVKKLEEELEVLSVKGRKDISERLESMQHQTIDELDDPFAEISEDKFFLEKRIKEINEILQNVEITELNENSAEVILGINVKVGFEGFEQVYQIVDPLEADPLNSKISVESPVGKALLGSKVGDTVDVRINGSIHKYRVLEIF